VDVTDISDYQPVLMVWDATLGSPTELQSYGGQTVLVPPDVLPLPARGNLLGLGGYSRTDGSGGWQWVLQGDVDPVDAFVDSLPAQGHWTNPTSRATVKTMVARLFSAGIPRTTIATQIPLFYNAVAAEVAAEQPH
jgi:hypothetical protein